MTYERISVVREEGCAHINMTTNYVRVSPTGMSTLECEVGVFILMSDVPALIAGLQAASDDEDAEYYADSEIDENGNTQADRDGLDAIDYINGGYFKVES